MDKFEKHIDKIIQKVLNEAAEDKASEVSEKLHGDQKKIDKNKNGKIDSEDFKLLRKKEAKEGFEDEIDIDRMDMNPEEDDEEDMDVDFSEFDPRDKSWEEIKAHTGAPDYSEIDEEPEYIDPKDGELDEMHFGVEHESTPGDYEGDEEAEEEAEELSAQEPTYVGIGLEDNKPSRMFGSFSDDHGWFDEKDRQFTGDFDFDYDEHKFDEFEHFMDFMGKGKHNQRWFAPGQEGKRFFNMYKDKFGPMTVRVSKLGEQEQEEGNAFTGALDDARDEGRKTFKVGDKEYQVTKEGKEIKEKWEGEVDVKKTGEYSDMSIEELNAAIKKQKAKNDKAKEAGKKVSHADKTKMSQLYFAKRAKQGWKGKGKAAVKESVTLTEDELISLIENIIVEQNVQKVKSNIADKTPKGLEVAEKVFRADGKENADSLADVAKKMKDYLKDGSKGKFDPNPKHFPKGNGELAKMDKKAYVADGDVEEYIEEFSYGGGMENLDYDEIKPNEEWMSQNIEGSSKTGNSGEYANAVQTDLGKKINAKRKKNMFSQEKKNSYKKADQPTKSSEASKEQKASDKLFTKLESTEDKKHMIVMEQIKKMKNLFSYNQRTQ